MKYRGFSHLDFLKFLGVSLFILFFCGILAILSVSIGIDLLSTQYCQWGSVVLFFVAIGIICFALWVIKEALEFFILWR